MRTQAPPAPPLENTVKMTTPFHHVTSERVMEPLRLPSTQLPPPVWSYTTMPVQTPQKRARKSKEALFWAGLAILIIWSTMLAIVAIIALTRP